MSDKTDQQVMAPGEQLPSTEMAADGGPAATPMQLLQIATQRGAGIDELEKFMNMQERWEANEARKAFVLAMTAFRGKCPIIDKTRSAHNSKYAGLAETLGQIQGLLSDCGLSHSWKTSQEEGKNIQVTCCVTHSLGHQECTAMSAEPDTSGSKNSIQAIASTVTYLERYTLFAVLGLASKEQDNDGKIPDGPISPELAVELEKLAEEVGADKVKFCKHFKIKSISDLPVSKYHNAKQMMENKRKGSTQTNENA